MMEVHSFLKDVRLNTFLYHIVIINTDSLCHIPHVARTVAVVASEELYWNILLQIKVNGKVLVYPLLICLEEVLHLL